MVKIVYDLCFFIDIVIDIDYSTSTLIEISRINVSIALCYICYTTFWSQCHLPARLLLKGIELRGGHPVENYIHGAERRKNLEKIVDSLE